MKLTKSAQRAAVKALITAGGRQPLSAEDIVTIVSAAMLEPGVEATAAIEAIREWDRNRGGIDATESQSLADVYTALGEAAADAVLATLPDEPTPQVTFIRADASWPPPSPTPHAPWPPGSGVQIRTTGDGTVIPPWVTPQAPPPPFVPWEPQVRDSVEWDAKAIRGDTVTMYGAVEEIRDDRYNVRAEPSGVIHVLSRDQLRPVSRPEIQILSPGDQVEWQDDTHNVTRYGVVADPIATFSPPPIPGYTLVCPEINPNSTMAVTTSKLRRAVKQDEHDDLMYVLTVLRNSEKAFNHLAERRNKPLSQQQARLCQRARKRLIEYRDGKATCLAHNCEREPVSTTDWCPTHAK